MCLVGTSLLSAQKNFLLWKHSPVIRWGRQEEKKVGKYMIALKESRLVRKERGHNDEMKAQC